MTAKRNENDGYGLVGRPDDTPVVAHTLRAAADLAHAPADAGPKAKGDDEKMSVFWRVFGGTILSIAALVGVTLYNNITTSISELRNELARANEARAAAVAELKADGVRKEEVNTRVTNIYNRIQDLQQQNNTQNATLTSLKTEVSGVKEWVTKHGADVELVKKDAAGWVDGLRKDQTAAAEAVRKDLAATADALKREQIATTDVLKKDVAALEAVKERLATLAVDLKAVRDDHQKLRGDVDRNQAYDFERRDRRDAQYRHLDEVLKELQKGLQDCREKLARVEGQVGPQAPPARPAALPKGGDGKEGARAIPPAETRGEDE